MKRKALVEWWFAEESRRVAALVLVGVGVVVLVMYLLSCGADCEGSCTS